MPVLSNDCPVGEAVEDYTKAIYSLERRGGVLAAVGTNEVAHRLG